MPFDLSEEKNNYYEKKNINIRSFHDAMSQR